MGLFFCFKSSHLSEQSMCVTEGLTLKLTDRYSYIKFDEVITIHGDSTFKLKESFFYTVDNIKT